MAMWKVKMSRPGGGSGVFEITIFASTPDEARRIAAAQYPGYKAMAVSRL